MNQITKAFILAAGLGTRMQSLTANTPKPLLLIKKKAIIEYHLIKLAQAGICDCLINTYLFPEQFIEKLGHGENYGLNISYSHEKEILNTAGGIIQALPFFDDQAFLVINGDIYTDFVIKPLLRYQLQTNELAHLVLAPNPSHHPDGDFYLNSQNQQLAINAHHSQATKYTYTGMGIYHPRLFQAFEPGHRGLGEVLRAQLQPTKNTIITGELFTGTWINVDTPARLKLAEQLVS